MSLQIYSATNTMRSTPGEDENDVVNRDPVVFPSIEDRVSGASPIVLCLLDDPPNPSVEQIVRGAAEGATLRSARGHQSW